MYCVFNQLDGVLMVAVLGYDMAEGLPAFEPYRYRYYKNNAVMVHHIHQPRGIFTTYILLLFWGGCNIIEFICRRIVYHMLLLFMLKFLTSC